MRRLDMHAYRFARTTAFFIAALALAASSRLQVKAPDARRRQVQGSAQDKADVLAFLRAL
jgi:hypothetical protein